MDNNLFELNYKQLLMECLINGELCNNRTNEKTYKLFNQSFNINLQKGFPIVTGKKIFFNKASRIVSRGAELEASSINELRNLALYRFPP